MVKRGEADAMICGTYGQYNWHLRYILDIIGLKQGVQDASALSALILHKGTFFFCDTYVTHNPSVEELTEMTVMASDVIRRFGIKPKVAMISHSNFGTANTESAVKAREAVRLLRERLPDLEVEGEMNTFNALDSEMRERTFPNSLLKGQANLFVFPNLDTANNAYNLLRVLGDGLAIGPILIGVARPAHILTPSVTARGIVNMTALAVADAQLKGAGGPGQQIDISFDTHQ
jgi:malate dehydrogenase (oxaloacetate-decarboxylating)(NADP+)